MLPSIFHLLSSIIFNREVYRYDTLGPNPPRMRLLCGDLRAGSVAESVPGLWQAAAGALRLAQSRRDADVRGLARPRAEYVALCRGAAGSRRAPSHHSGRG